MLELQEEGFFVETFGFSCIDDFTPRRETQPHLLWLKCGAPPPSNVEPSASPFLRLRSEVVANSPPPLPHHYPPRVFAV